MGFLAVNVSASKLNMSSSETEQHLRHLDKNGDGKLGAKELPAPVIKTDSSDIQDANKSGLSLSQGVTGSWGPSTLCDDCSVRTPVALWFTPRVELADVESAWG